MALQEHQNPQLISASQSISIICYAELANELLLIFKLNLLFVRFSGTPGTLRKRKRSSTSKAQRALNLEHFTEKKKLPLNGKRSLSFKEQPTHLVSNERPSSPGTPAGGHDVPDDSSSDESEVTANFYFQYM